MNITVRHISPEHFTNLLTTRVCELVALVDQEFDPPLSSRESTTQTDFHRSQSPPTASIEPYCRALLAQEFIIAEDSDGTLLGFLSFRHNYVVPGLDLSPSNYISTVIVHPAYRRQGITTQLYETMLHALPPHLQMPRIITRTWTGKNENEAHLSLLKKLGFQTVKTIENDRRPGVHTVYLALETHGASK